MRRIVVQRRLSALRPLAWRLRLPAAALGLLGGEILATRGPLAAAALVAGALAVPAGLRVHRALGTASAIVAGAALAGWLIAGRQAAERGAALAAPAGATSASFVAVVERVEPRRGFGSRPAAALDLRVAEVEGGSAMVAGDGVRLSVWRVARAWHPGETIRVRALLRRPRGLCNAGVDRYAATLWRRGIRWVASVKSDAALYGLGPARADPRTALARARAATASAIDASLPAADAAVVRAIVVGETSGLPPDLRDAYARTGTTHVLSVSGLHIAIVAGCAFALARAVLARVPPLATRLAPARAAAIAALMPAAAYAVFAGAAVATVRSLVMAALYLLAVALRRPPDLLVAVSAAAIAICIRDAEAAFDVSFQLSFAAVLAIVGGMRAAESSALAPWLRPAKDAPRWRRALAVVASSVVVSIAAGLGTAPLTAAHFGVVPVVGVAANLIVVPLVGWGALLLGLAGAALLAASQALAHACFATAGWCVELAGAIAMRLAALPGAAVSVAAPSPAAATGWLVAIFGALYAPPRRRVAAVLLGAGLALIATGAETIAASGRVRVSFMDVGQGDAVLLETPRGALLVDAGGALGDFDPGSWVVVPGLRARGIARLGALVLSHPDLDHYGGMPAVVRSLPVAAYVSTGARSESRAFAALEAALGDAVVPRAVGLAGTTPAGALGALEAEVLYPPVLAGDLSTNDSSLVLALRYGALRVLLPGDLEARGESRLVGRAGAAAATLLKAPHHGSRTSSSEAFVRAVRPGLVVAGVGARNRFGLPSPEVPARWRRYGAAWLQTGRDGEVIAESDGQLVSVSSCRERTAEVSVAGAGSGGGRGR